MQAGWLWYVLSDGLIAIIFKVLHIIVRSEAWILEYAASYWTLEVKWNS